MRKRVGLSYAASCILPLLSVTILMLRAFHPWTRYVAVATYLVGCALLVFAVRKHVSARKRLSAVKNHALDALEELGLLRKRAIFAFFVFTASLLVFPTLIPLESRAFLTRNSAELRQEFERAEMQLRRSEVVVMEAHRDFTRLCARADLRDPASTNAVRSAWAAYLDHAILLDYLVSSYKHFYQLAVRHSDLADRAFLLGYGSLVIQMHAGHRMTRAIGNRRTLEALLNEPNERLGLGPDTYLRFVEGLTSHESLIQLEAGYAYLKLLKKAGKLDHLAPERDHVEDLARATIRLFGKDPSLLIDAPFDRLERRAFSVWFPLQKGAAQAMSPVRATHRDNFISEADLAWARERLLPGDILLERRNWYLTNLGIPGYWPHAALYVGSISELDTSFADEARAVTGGMAPSLYIQEHFPKAFEAYRALDAEGRSPRVIEAIGEGVVLQPFEVSGHADSMAALRPKISDEARLQAVLRALSHYGKPYDFNFEFSTDETVVCSELVYKALAKQGPEGGLVFDLTEQNGRFVLPPNDIARVFDAEYGQRGQQMDFVFFLDENERLGRATYSDLSTFRSSWRRKKWHID